MQPTRNPEQLEPFEGDGALQVVIETPAGNRNKFFWDHEAGVFRLRKVLPAGMAFPYDFGFVPQTQAEDGDPIDVLLLMDEPAYPGCVIRARLIGVIEAEQTEGGQMVRNDRLVAVAEASHEYANVHRLDDLPRKWVEELSLFFVHYQQLEGKEYRLLGTKDADAAKKLIEKARSGKRRAA